jgi:chaperonin GroES
MGTEHSISSPSEIELIDDRILVRYIKPKDQTDAGIYLPESVVGLKEEAVQAGEVIAVGPGRFNSNGDHEAMMDILPGDIVFFAKFMGWQLLIPDAEDKEVDYRVFGQHDLLGMKKVAPREHTGPFDQGV